MAKVSFKDILLEKGDKIALGVGGVLAGGFALYGLVQVASATSAASKANEFAAASQSVKSRVGSEGSPAPDLPAWVTKTNKFVRVNASDFKLTGPPFEAVNTPDLTRQNPNVLGIVNAQFDILTYPFRANDIIEVGDGEIKVGVIKDLQPNNKDLREIKQQNKNQLDRFRPKTQYRGRDAMIAGRLLPQPPPGQQGQTPPPGGQFGNPGGGLGGPGGGLGGPGRGPGGPGGGYGGQGGYGLGGQFGGGAATPRATDVTTEYVKPEEAVNRVLAQTVYPLRAVCVTAAFPLKAQIEEVRVALRLKTAQEAIEQSSTTDQEGPVFDGIEVQRRSAPPGSSEVGDWQPVDIERQYATKIGNRVLENSPDNPYLAYFIRLGQKLVTPIPAPIDGLGKYPEIQLPQIVEGIAKLKAASVQPQTESELAKMLKGKVAGSDPFLAGFASQGGAGAAGGPGGPGGFGTPNYGTGMGGQQRPGGPDGGALGGQPGPGGRLQAEVPPIDYTLIRFLDTTVEPGFTYQYRVRVRMKNPNNNKFKSLSADAAEVETLTGPFVAIPNSIILPPEFHFYAEESKQYVEHGEKLVGEYKNSSPLRKALEVEEVAEGRKAAVQIQRWTENLLIGGSTGQKEPVGTWVVADLPVGPGEFVGQRQLVELPLWSSGQQSYVLRETSAGTKIPGVQLKGWPINFRTNLVLIDFDGGKVTARQDGRTITDDSDSQLLILHPDGSLQVRDSGADAKDRERAERAKVWDDWVAKVRTQAQTPPAGLGGQGGRGGPGGQGGFGGPGGSN